MLTVPIALNTWGNYSTTDLTEYNVRIKIEPTPNTAPETDFDAHFHFYVHKKWAEGGGGDNYYLKLSDALLDLLRACNTFESWYEFDDAPKPIKNKFFLIDTLLYVQKSKYFANHTCKILLVESNEQDQQWFGVPLHTQGYEVFLFDKTGKEVNKEVFFSEAWLQVFLNFYDLNLCTFEQLVQNFAQKISTSIDDLRQLRRRRPLLVREKIELDFLAKIQAADTLEALQSIENEVNSTPTDPELIKQLLHHVSEKKGFY